VQNVPGNLPRLSAYPACRFSHSPGANEPTCDSRGDNYVIYADKGNKEMRFKEKSAAERRLGGGGVEA